jgi:hypothetical protein
MPNMSTEITERPRARRKFRLLSALFAAVVFAAGLSAVVLESSSTPASAGVVSFSQCNNHDLPATTGAPLSVTCSVDIINTVNELGQTSSVAYTRVCTSDGCTGDVATGNAVNAIHQCNGSDNVGGSTTICTVTVTNNITLNAPVATGALTLNQCIGSGGGGGTNMTACIPSSSGGATVTQCNGSGTGGGGMMTCTASGTVSADFPVTVDQCNGSENGGGSFVTCNVTMTTNTFVAVPTTTPGGGTPGGGLPGGGTPETGTPGTDTPGTGIPGIPTGPPVVEVPPNYTG